MYDSHDFMERAGARLFAKAGQRLETAPASRGASDRKAITPQVAREMLVSVAAAAAAELSPTANIGALRHGFRSFTSEAFLDAFNRARLLMEREQDAFAIAVGVVDAAVVLAGWVSRSRPSTRTIAA